MSKQQSATVESAETKPSSAPRSGSARTEDLAMLIRRLCRVIARHDANNTVRDQALDYLHRHNLGGSPLRGKAPNDPSSATGAGHNQPKAK